MADGPSRVVLEAWLKKKSPAGVIRKVWQQRYWKLSEDALYYYKKEKDTNAQGSISMSHIDSAILHDQEGSKRTGRFDIIVMHDGATRTFCLLAKDKEQAVQWVNTTEDLIKNVRAHENNTGERNSSSPRGHTSGKPDKKAKKAKGKFWKNSKGLLTKLKVASTMLAMQKEKADDNKKEPFLLHISKEESNFFGFGMLFRAHNRKIPHSEFTLHSILKDSRLFTSKIGVELQERMRKLDHPFVWKQVYHGETRDELWAMYHPALDTQTSLLHYLQSIRKFPEDVVRYFGAQLLTVIDHVHSLNYCFRNLTSERLWLTSKGCVIAKDPLLCLDLKEMPKGLFVPVYTAPGEEGPAGDWWRFGVFLYEMATGVPPIREGTEEKTSSGDIHANFDVEKLKFPPWVSAEFIDLVKKLLLKEPAARLGASDVQDLKGHKWFAMDDKAWARVTSHPSPPEWLRENVLDKTSKSNVEFRPHVTANFELNLKVVCGRGLSSQRDNKSDSKEVVEEKYCCRVKFGNVMHRTQEKASNNPQWDEQFKFNVSDPSPNAELVVQVYFTGKGYDILLGDVCMRLSDIQAAYKNELSGEYSIILQNGFPSGGIVLEVQWKQNEDQEKLDEARHFSLPEPLEFYYGYELISDDTNNAKTDHVAIDEDSEDEHKAPPAAEANSRGSSVRDHSSVMRKKKKLKKRFEEAGFDLDLSYITPNTIAMAFPTAGFSATSRNPASEVQRLLKERHPDTRVYNLCMEKQYPHSTFPNSGGVVEFPFDSQNAPPFQYMIDFCQDCEGWLKEDEDRVVVVHCKEGRGRAGVMVCAFLIMSGVCKSGPEALIHFTRMRMHQDEGVNVPSHRRYVSYFARYFREYHSMGKPFPYESIARTLHRVRFTTVPNVKREGGCEPYFVCLGPVPHKEVLYNYSKALKGNIPKCSAQDRHAELVCVDEHDGSLGVPLYGDVLFIFYDHNEKFNDERIFHFWLNVAMVQHGYLSLSLADLDAVKDKTGYHRNFKVELFFSDCMD